MIDKRLNKAGIIAIPLLPQPNAQLGLVMPTHLVVEKQLSFSTMISPFSQQLVDAVNIRYKLVRRAILQGEIFDEKILVQEEIIKIPVEFLPMIVSYSAVKSNLNALNQSLLAFQFSDCLQYFKCEIDAAILDEIIEGLETENEIIDNINYELN